jgi:NADP-dependent aldehyde dehydrogenase
MLTGKHLVAGDWIATDSAFANAPTEGPADRFCVGTPALVDRAAEAAEAAFPAYAALPRATRAAFLRRIADEIEARGSAITEIGCRETGLPPARLESERGRTCGQLRLFADHILQDGWLDLRHDPALPDRKPLPRPELRMVQRPIGPVAVFGASNFPLAFSTAGGDTASALAAGCPVVVKGHSAHPGTADIVAQAILAAIRATGVPSGVFALIQGGRRDVGEALVQHPLVRAVGFTGSLVGGRALFDLCAARPDPIPFFGELGSVNPMFLLPGAMAVRGAQIAAGWAASLTLGAGQFCTNPGIAVLIDGPEADAFVTAAKTALAEVPAQCMLTDGMAEAFRTGRDRMAAAPGATSVLDAGSSGRMAGPALFQTTGAAWLARHDLAEEVFGPLGLVVRVRDAAGMSAIARKLDGQLAACLHVEDADLPLARDLLPVLERKAGRILFNGFSTGVEVADAMVHGGPYPASTNFGHTSVGTLSIRRWLRPVCFQNLPEGLAAAP